jgi:hypothetical protein
MNTFFEVEEAGQCVEYCRMHSNADHTISEIAEILAAALMRLHAKKSSQFRRHAGESLLDMSSDQSRDANRISADEGDD